VKIIESNGITYYNLLIYRNQENPLFFENLVLVIDSEDNDILNNAYTVKYIKDENSLTSSETPEINILLGSERVITITRVCITVCNIPEDGYGIPHNPHRPECGGSQMCWTSVDTGDDGSSGGGTNFGGNGSGSGGGGTNGGGSPDTNPTNPPNQNGQTNNIPPLELILDPVLEEEPIIIDPCSELNKILKPRKNPFVNPGSKTITDALIHLDSDPVYNATNETGYNLIYDSNNEYAAIQVPFENTGVDYVKYSKNERVIGGAHAHQSIAAPMPSVLDLIPLLRFYENFDFGLMNISDPSQNYMIPFHIMTCKDGGIYALKIENLTKFQAMGTSIFSNALKSADFNARLANIYQKIYNPTQRKYEEAFVKYISNYNNKSFDTGVGTYFLKPTEIQINGVTKSIKQWNKLSLNSQGHIVEIPCN
jgi:hypothetical protein